MLRAALLSACASPTVLARPARLSRLRVDPSGTIRDPATGAPFLAKGVNWGSRLTPFENGTSLYNASDVTIAQELFPGMNFVRLVLDYYSGGTCSTDIYSADARDTGWIAPNWLAYIDDAVRWTAAAGVRVTITTRDNVGTASPHAADVTTSDVPCDADYVGNVTAREMWFDTWRFLARRYRNATNIAWYGPASEPHLLHKRPLANGTWAPCHTQADVTALFNGVVRAIREVDPDTPVAVAPHGYEACPPLESMDRLDDDNLIYAMNWPCRLGKSAAAYGDTAECASFGGASEYPTCVPGCSDGGRTFTYNRSVVRALLAPELSFTQLHSVPLWVDQMMCPPGEFNNSHAWLADTAAELDAFRSTHFSWWTWKSPDTYGDPAAQAVLTLREGASKSHDKKDQADYVVNDAVYALYRGAF